MKFYICEAHELADGTQMVKSDSNPNKEYKVVIKNGKVTCGCPGFINYRKCKHSAKIASGCTYNQFIDDIPPHSDGQNLFCPKCGRRAIDSGL